LPKASFMQSQRFTTSRSKETRKEHSWR